MKSFSISNRTWKRKEMCRSGSADLSDLLPHGTPDSISWYYHCVAVDRVWYYYHHVLSWAVKRPELCRIRKAVGAHGDLEQRKLFESQIPEPWNQLPRCSTNQQSSEPFSMLHLYYLCSSVELLCHFHSDLISSWQSRPTIIKISGLRADIIMYYSIISYHLQRPPCYTPHQITIHSPY